MYELNEKRGCLLERRFRCFVRWYGWKFFVKMTKKGTFFSVFLSKNVFFVYLTQIFTAFSL